MRFGFGLSGFGFNAATGNNRLVTGAAGPTLLWSALATGAIADPAAWSVTGAAISITGGKMVFTAATNSSLLTLTGAYATALTALLAASTNYTVQYVVSVWVAGANGRIRLCEGVITAVFTMSGPGTYSTNYLSGVAPATPLRVYGFSTDPCTYTLDDIKIYST